LRRVQPKAVPVQKQSVVEDRSALDGDLESREVAEEIALASTLSQNQSESIWLDVPAIPHAFVINVGRLFEIFCPETFPATIHRVRYTPDKTAKPETSQPRISLALFFAPDWDVTVVPPVRCGHLVSVRYALCSRDPTFCSVTAGNSMSTVARFRMWQQLSEGHLKTLQSWPIMTPEHSNWSS